MDKWVVFKQPSGKEIYLQPQFFAIISMENLADSNTTVLTVFHYHNTKSETYLIEHKPETIIKVIHKCKTMHKELKDIDLGRIQLAQAPISMQCENEAKFIKAEA